MAAGMCAKAASRSHDAMTVAFAFKRAKKHRHGHDGTTQLFLWDRGRELKAGSAHGCCCLLLLLCCCCCCCYLLCSAAPRSLEGQINGDRRTEV
jgi:hypothetical protein